MKLQNRLLVMLASCILLLGMVAVLVPVGAGRAFADDQHAFFSKTECVGSGSHPCYDCSASYGYFNCGDSSGGIPQGYVWGACKQASYYYDCSQYTRYCGGMAYDCIFFFRDPSFDSWCGSSGNYCKSI